MKFKALLIFPVIYFTALCSAHSVSEPIVYIRNHPYYIHHFPDPVNLRNGNLFLPSTDLTFNGTNVKLSFERFYNSHLAGKESPIGYGWRHNYLVNVAEPVMGTPVIEEADGFFTPFRPTVALRTKIADQITEKRKEFESSQGKPKSQKFYKKFREKLIKKSGYLIEMLRLYIPSMKTSPNGTYYSLRRRRQLLIKNNEGYKRKFLDGTRQHFDKEGRLVKIEDSNSNYIAFEYKNNKLLRAHDRMGLSISFGYTHDGKISSISDPANRTCRYLYNDKGELAKAIGLEKETESFFYDELHRITGITLASGEDVKIEYDKNMRVVEQIGPGKKKSTYRYGRKKGVISGEVIDARGEKTTFKFDLKNNKTVQINPLGKTKITYFDPKTGNVSKLVNEAGKTTKFYYDKHGNIARTVNPLRTKNTYRYKGPNNRISSANRSGLRSKLTYDKNGNLTVRELPDGSKFLYRYNRYGNLTKTITPAGKTFSWNYDEYGRMTEEIDPEGNKTRFVSDKAGRITKIIGPDGATFSLSYDASDSLTSLSDEVGRTYKAKHDKAGRITEIVDARGAKTKFEYNETGLLKSKTNSLGHTFKYAYDGAGNRVSITDPAGNIHRYKYDALNRLIEEINPLGQKQTYRYDPVGNLIMQTSINGLAQFYRYDDLGRLTGLIRPDGRGFIYTYGRLEVTEQDELGRRTICKYDPRGRIIEKTTPDGVRTSFKYNPDSKLTEEKKSTGEHLTYIYDDVDNLVEIRDSKGTVKKFVYDKLGRLVEESRGNAKWKLKYDPAGQLTRIIKPDRGSINLKYNAQGDVAMMRDPEGARETYRYNPEGQLIARKLPDGETHYYEYDVLGRRKAERFPDGEKLTYTYDAAGNLLKVASPKELLAEFIYDKKGRIIQARNGTVTLSYKYDKLSRVTEEKDLTRGKALNFTYDSKGNLKSIYADGKPLRAFNYNKKNQLTAIKDDRRKIYRIFNNNQNLAEKIVYPNGMTSHYSYDSSSNIKSIEASLPNGKTAFSRNYEWDSSGNLKKEFSSDLARDFYYDELGRISRVKGKTKDGYLYKYDKNGNLTLKRTGKKRIKYSFDDSNRLIKAGSNRFKYDSKGNLSEKLTDKGSTKYEYNIKGQLTGVLKNGAKILGIAYDPFGRKYLESKEGSKSFFRHYSFSTLFEENSKGKIKKSFVYSPRLKDIDFPLGLIMDGKSLYPLLDAYNNIVKITTADAKVAESLEYEPFGKQTKEGDTPVNLAFAGRPYDKGTGLADFRYRHYDPDTGRFLSKDPLTPLGGFNPYTFALNNPLKYRDPLGLVSWTSSKGPAPGEDRGTTSVSGRGPVAGEPGAGPGHGTPAGEPRQVSGSSEVRRADPPPLYPHEKTNYLKIAAYAGIIWGVKQISQIFREDLSPVTGGLLGSLSGLPNPVASFVGSLAKKYMGLSGSFYTKDPGPRHPSQDYEEFKKDLLQVCLTDENGCTGMSLKSFREKYPIVLDVKQGAKLCERVVSFKSGDQTRTETLSLCDVKLEEKSDKTPGETVTSRDRSSIESSSDWYLGAREPAPRQSAYEQWQKLMEYQQSSQQQPGTRTELESSTRNTTPNRSDYRSTDDTRRSR